MKIIFWGTPKYALDSLNALIKQGHEIIAAVTQPDKKRSRGNKLTFSPVKQRCLELNIPIFTPNNIKTDMKIINKILNIQADIYIVVAYGQILPKIILDRPKYGCWNSHASLLPKWRGAAPIQWSILEGDKKTGIGIMLMEEGLDTGPILLQESISINQEENFLQLESRLSQLSGELLIRAIALLETNENKESNNPIQSLKLINQADLGEKIRYARMLKKQDYFIDWKMADVEIHRKILGLFPRSYTFWKNKRLAIHSSRLIYKLSQQEIEKNLPKNIESDFLNIEPGTIISISDKLGIIVSTGNKPILINTAQIEGKNPNSTKVLIQQMKPKIGDKFN